MSESSYVNRMAEIVLQAADLFHNQEDAEHIHVKGRADYVTDMDFHVQQYLQAALQKEWPKIQFMGEEKDNSDIDFSGMVWILDPVDGTTNLIHDMKASMISLGLARNREVIAGVVCNPFSGDVWTAEKGGGAFLNGKSIHVSRADKLEDSLVAIGTAPYYREYADWTFQASKNIFLKAQDIRRSGSAALELAYIASGRLEGMFERVLQPWDFAAGLCLVEEAGGTVSDLEGNPVNITARGGIVAGNGRVNQEIIRCLP